MSENTQTTNNLFDNAVILSLEIKSFGTTRKLRNEEYTVDADKEKTRASKKLLECNEMKSIRKYDGETRQLVMSRSIPSQFRSGMYVVKLTAVSALDDILRVRQGERQLLIDRFLSIYEQIRYQDSLPADQGGLGSCYHDSDYPDLEKVRQSFQFLYSYTEVQAPGRLQRFNPELYRREQEKASEMWRNAVEEGKLLLREQFQGILSHLLERLTPNADGTKKVFRDSLVYNAIDFLNNLESRDVANDTEVLELASQMTALFNGVTPKTLRTNEALQDALTAKANEVKAKIDGMIGVAPVRHIDFDEL